MREFTDVPSDRQVLAVLVYAVYRERMQELGQSLAEVINAGPLQESLGYNLIRGEGPTAPSEVTWQKLVNTYPQLAAWGEVRLSSRGQRLILPSAEGIDRYAKLVKSGEALLHYNARKGGDARCTMMWSPTTVTVAASPASNAPASATPTLRRLYSLSKAIQVLGVVIYAFVREDMKKTGKSVSDVIRETGGGQALYALMSGTNSVAQVNWDRLLVRYPHLADMGVLSTARRGVPHVVPTCLAYERFNELVTKHDAWLFGGREPDALFMRRAPVRTVRQAPAAMTVAAVAEVVEAQIPKTVADPKPIAKPAVKLAPAPRQGAPVAAIKFVMRFAKDPKGAADFLQASRSLEEAGMSFTDLLSELAEA